MKFGILLSFLAVAAAFNKPTNELRRYTQQALGDGGRRNARLHETRRTEDAGGCTVDEENWAFSTGRRGASDTRGTPAVAAKDRLGQFIDAVQPPGLTSDAEEWYNILAVSPRELDGGVPAPGDDDSSYYQNGFNPSSNYIAVIEVVNNNGPYSSTDATWDLWRQVKGDEDRGDSEDYGALTGIIQYACANAPARDVAADIFEGETETNQVRVFQDGDQEFDALLGIPNGVFPSRLLTEYPASMGTDRQIKSITAWLDDPNTDTDKMLMGVMYTYS